MKRSLVVTEVRHARRWLITSASLLSATGLLIVAVEVAARLAAKGVFASSEWRFLASASSVEFLWLGAFDTLKVAAVASILCLGAATALGWSLASPSLLLRRLAAAVVVCTGSVPLLVILYLLDYSFPFHGIGADPFALLVAGIVGYNVGPVSETFAAGLRSVEAGQRLTALSLGLRPLQVELFVVAPQGIRRMLPALVTNFVGIVKDTSLAFLLPYGDLLDHAQQLNVTEGARAPLLAVLSVAALFYVAVGIVGSRLAGRLEVTVGSGPPRRRRPDRFPVSWITLRGSR